MTAGGGERRLSPARAHELCAGALRQVGVPEDEAHTCAGTLVEASLRGVDSHGIGLLPVFAERIRCGQIRPGRRPLVRREGLCTALVDGQRGMGPTAARFAVELAAGKARSAGVGAVSVRECNYVGALATYVEGPARDGLLLLAAANATPRVAPFGGAEGLHGTNPMAWAVPVRGEEPMVFDAATGFAAARVNEAADEGRPLVAGVAVDATGRPTTDPAAALSGALLPVGGVLGYGFGLLVDLLTGGLAGAPVGRQIRPVTDLHGPYGCSFFVLAIDPDHLGGAAEFSSAAARLARDARNTRTAEGVVRVRVPGDRARQTRAERVEAGIPLTEGRWTACIRRLSACGVDTADWR